MNVAEEKPPFAAPGQLLSNPQIGIETRIAELHMSLSPLFCAEPSGQGH